MDVKLTTWNHKKSKAERYLQVFQNESDGEIIEEDFHLVIMSRFESLSRRESDVFDWKLGNILWPLVPNGKFVKSEVFSMAGYCWRLIMYPDGDNLQSQGYVSLYALLETKDIANQTQSSADNDLSLKINLGIMNSNKRRFAKEPIIIHINDLQENIYGYSTFIKRETLRNTLLPNGYLTVFCHIDTVTFDPDYTKYI